MASLIDFSSLTLNEEEARSLSECIQEQVYVNPDLAQTHQIMTGVEMDKRIPILGQYGLVGKVDPGDCSTNDESAQIPTSQKTWTPKLISSRLIHCQAQIPDLLKFWKKSRIALGTWEEVDNEMMAFINDRVVDAMLKAIIRVSEFGDTTHSPVGDGAGNEKLTVGQTKAYWNILNGMWNQIFTDQAGSALSYRYTITENSAGTKVAQLALASDRALNMFRDMYNNADPRVFESRNLVFQVSRNLFTNWQDFMEDKSLVFMLDRTEDGTTKWQYRGIPIIVRSDWDRIVQTYFDNGTTYDLPNRAILTDIANIPIGTSDEGSLSDLDSFYDKKDKKHYIDLAFKLDQKNLEEYAMCVAY